MPVVVLSYIGLLFVPPTKALPPLQVEGTWHMHNAYYSRMGKRKVVEE